MIKRRVLIVIAALLVSMVACFIVNLFSSTNSLSSISDTTSYKGKNYDKIVHDERDEILRLLVWEGHAPKIFVENFEKQIEKKYGRKIKLEIRYVTGSDNFYASVRNRSVDLIMMNDTTLSRTNSCYHLN